MNEEKRNSVARRLANTLSLQQELDNLQAKLIKKREELDKREMLSKARGSSDHPAMNAMFEFLASKELKKEIAQIEYRIAEIGIELGGEKPPLRELRKMRQGRKITPERRDMYVAIDEALDANDKTPKKRRLSKPAIIRDLCWHDKRFLHEKRYYERLRKAYDKWVKNGRK